MKRYTCEPRLNWKEKSESLGFFFHSLEGSYWNEAAFYEFSSEEINIIEKATNELHEMCLAAAQHIIDKDLFSLLGIPARFVSLIHRSWEYNDHALYGRFDLAYDGESPPKLLEYNADTPTSLLEASIIQWEWMKESHPHANQFNSIHEKLVEGWKGYRLGNRLLHFTSIIECDEDLDTIQYMMDTAVEAGVTTRWLAVDEIGWDSDEKKFVGKNGEAIELLFKLYPWEWMVNEEFGKHLIAEPLVAIEPIWKMLLSNKGILPILWELFPGHPNLLSSYWESMPLGNTFVCKPLLSREGANVTICKEGEIIAQPGNYGSEGFIFQEYKKIPQFDGLNAIIGSWVINGWSAGIGIREDTSIITSNTSNFVPHIFV